MLLPARPGKPPGGIHLLHDIGIDITLEVLRSTATDHDVSVSGTASAHNEKGASASAYL